MTVFSSKYLFWIVVIVALVLLLLLFFYIHKQAKKRKVVNLALNEYKAWGQGQIKETNADMRPTLSKYWNAANAPDYGYGAAWSAAWISWIFKEAGAGSKFPYSSSHSVYIREAVKNRQNGIKSGAIIGYKPTEYKPKVGDLICKPRQSGVTYETTHAYDSHCDLVVDIQNNQAITIGGNVSNSVTKTIYQLTKDGYIDGGNVHAVLQNAI